MATTVTTAGTAYDVNRRLVITAGPTVAAVLAAAAWLLVTHEGAATTVQRATDYELTSAVATDVAVKNAAKRAGFEVAAPNATLPGGLNLWVAAAEYGPEGAGWNLNSVVLDYYVGSTPTRVNDLLNYRGPRVQIVYRAVPGTPPHDYEAVPEFSDDRASVFVSRSAVPGYATDVYMVQGVSQSAEVRVWNPEAGPIPPPPSCHRSFEASLRPSGDVYQKASCWPPATACGSVGGRPSPRSGLRRRFGP